MLKQHLDRDYIIAAPMLKNGKTNYLLIEYKGNEAMKFYHLAKHLLATLGTSGFHLYQGKNNQKIQLFIKVDNITLKVADKRVKEISSKLQKHMSKAWKCLPSPNLPDQYNIATLPYKKLL